MRIDSSGNVGIGISSPATTLDVVGNTTMTTSDNTDTLSLISSDADENSGPNLRFHRNSGGPADNDLLSFISFDGRNDNSQDVTYAIIKTLIQDVSDDTEDAQFDLQVIQGGSSRSRFRTNNTETIFNDDSVDLDFRVESDNSTHALFVEGSSGHAWFSRTTSLGGVVVDILHPGTSEYGLRIDSSNTTGTQYHLDLRRGGTQAGYLTSNSATTVVLNNASDERLKENIENSNSAIQDLKDIQVRQFDWIDNIDTHRDFGFVAQELINVVPEAVTQGSDELDDNGKPKQSWGVDYSHIVPRLVKAVQEQQTKIEELEARITTLENA
jgi:hypothetical protein